MQHNEAEKKRIRTINKSVDDIRIILDVDVSSVVDVIGSKDCAQSGQSIHSRGGRCIYENAAEGA